MSDELLGAPGEPDPTSAIAQDPREVALGVGLGIPLAVGLAMVGAQWWITGPLAGLVVLLHNRAATRRGALAVTAVAIAFGVAAGFGSGLVLTTAANIADPPQWDFRYFWLHARVAVLGLNFYEPEHASALAAAFENTPDFLPELDFFYPPPTMFIVGPLGLFEIETASLAWAVLHTVVLVADIWLLWSLFLRDHGVKGLLLAASLLVLLRASQSTVNFAQTNFLLLLFVLLAWRDQLRPRAGLWLALGAVVKPIAALLGGFLVLRRAWPGLTVALIVGVGLMVASGAVFGQDVVATYLVANPATSAVDWLYTQEINQSLLATILRLFPSTSSGPDPIAVATLLIAAVVIVGLTAVVCSARRSVDAQLAFAILIAAALMLYPSSLAHYSVLLVVPIAYLLTRRPVVPGGSSVMVAVMVPTYLFAGSRFSFFAVALIWTVLVGLAAPSIVRDRPFRGGRRGTPARPS